MPKKRGRPETANVPMTINISEATRRALRIRSAETGQTIGSIVEAALAAQKLIVK